MGVIDEYYFPLLKDLAVNALGDILYGGWETFPEIYYEQNVYALNTLQNKQIWELFKDCHKKGGEKRMETESLVSYLYQVKGYIESGSQNLQVGPIREIIQALRRGEKNRGYKKQADMWWHLKSIIKSGNVYTLLPEDLSNKGACITVIVRAFEKIEERHLEKPKKRIVELVKELDKDVRTLLKMLEEKMGD